MIVPIILPWRGGCEHRERAREYLTQRYEATWPHLKLVWATQEGEQWCKARAIYPHLKTAKKGPVVIADADVWCDGIPEAVAAIEDGAPWAMPHTTVHRLSREGTDAFMAGEPLLRTHYAERPRLGMSGGGILVAHRDTLLEIPPDPRYIGWGGEDESWAMALKMLAGKLWRGKVDLIHLWHPPQQRMSRRWGSPEHRALRQRYQRAKASKSDMRAMIQEVHEALSSM